MAQLGSAHGYGVRDRQAGEERMGHHMMWAEQQAGWQEQRDRITSAHTSLCSSTAPHRTGSTVPPPQHGKAAPRVGVMGLQGLYSHKKQA